jgi:hypothetical protein
VDDTCEGGEDTTRWGSGGGTRPSVRERGRTRLGQWDASPEAALTHDDCLASGTSGSSRWERSGAEPRLENHFPLLLDQLRVFQSVEGKELLLNTLPPSKENRNPLLNFLCFPHLVVSTLRHLSLTARCSFHGYSNSKSASRSLQRPRRTPARTSSRTPPRSPLQKRSSTRRPRPLCALRSRRWTGRTAGGGCPQRAIAGRCVSLFSLPPHLAAE